MVPSDCDILKELDETIQLHKDISPSPFFYNRVIQKLENSREKEPGKIIPYVRFLLRPIPVAAIIIIGVAFGIAMVSFSSWASYTETQQSLAANEEAFSAYYLGNNDQLVYDAYYSAENTEPDGPKSK